MTYATSLNTTSRKSTSRWSHTGMSWPPG